LQPKWQNSPVVPLYAPYNWDGFRYTTLARVWEELKGARQITISHVANIPTPFDPNLSIEGNNYFLSHYVGEEDGNHTEPFSDLFYPILNPPVDSANVPQDALENDVAGVVAVTFYWRDLIKHILPSGSDGMNVVIANTCNQTFTYELRGEEAIYLGPSDLHDSEFDHLKRSVPLGALGVSDRYSGLPLSNRGCQFMLRTYPSKTMRDGFDTSYPVTFTASAVVIFLFTSMVFVIYDYLVERRQKKVLSSAIKSNAIVSSLFPKTVRDRLFQANNGAFKGDTQNSEKSRSKMKSLKNYLTDEKSAAGSDQSPSADAPIADLFPQCTVLFADISGFTAWSSERSPSQVFVLLETLYGAFDRIADRRGVFKVETIGDCYVAVTGLPIPKRDHATVMVRFARDCRDQMSALTRSMEVTLGPGTDDLQLRFGLHSGPVTAGVLRGQKSRFQLFGDTVNTAARMESTGTRNRIQVSQETADLLLLAGKTRWMTRRADMVQAKGKGKLQTYWLFDNAAVSTFVSDNDSSRSVGRINFDVYRRSDSLQNGKLQRLIEWSVDLLTKKIKEIVARRSASLRKRASKGPSNSSGLQYGEFVLDEVKEIIELPDFDASGLHTHADPSSVDLGPEVVSQLKQYIVSFAEQYHDNRKYYRRKTNMFFRKTRAPSSNQIRTVIVLVSAFHNFDHAIHVAMSVAKLLSRIVAPDIDIEGSDGAFLHDHTYGITSDPLTQFACILAALIHDVDHQGVPNTVLVKENDPLALKYRGRSVAEQNSVDIAWSLMMEERFDHLRDAICPTDVELARFRQLVVNSVMATDIMDKDLKQARNLRWDKAFSATSSLEESKRDQVNRKATIVIEHLIQASDVSHTMQHWDVYRKWNERLFEEMYLGFKAGRLDKDPAEFWYKGEIGFFDFYIIPLAKKLSECGLFGVSSDEYLTYAQRNRDEWEKRGEEVVLGYLEKRNSKSK
jgi:class 3 adenylate cyclase